MANSKFTVLGSPVCDAATSLLCVAAPTSRALPPKFKVGDHVRDIGNNDIGVVQSFDVNGQPNVAFKNGADKGKTLRCVPRDFEIAVPSARAGRPMVVSEYERIFQVTAVMPEDTSMPVSARNDLRNKLTTAQVIASIEASDAAMLLRNRSRSNPQQHGLEPLDWRMQIDAPGTHGEIVTIAQQCVYVGNKSLFSRRPRTVEVLKHVLESDPDLAWGRIRFDTGKVPDVTIILSCTKARPDLVATFANHPSADFYLPTYARPKEAPCPGLSLINLISQTINYNRGLAITREKDPPWRLQARDQCAEALIALHNRRHGLEQKMLERVMQTRLNRGNRTVCVMCQNLITYTVPLRQL